MLDIVRQEAAREAIGKLMNPQRVVFVGASSSIEKPSGQPIRNLLRSAYTGEVIGINARGQDIDGRPTLTSVDEIEGDIDLGFVTVSAPQCANAIRALGRKGAQVAVLAVGGFAELGTPAGRQLTEDIRAAANEAGVRLVGPVCNGLYSTPNNLPLGYNAIHTRSLVPGRVALVSHSGALVAPFVQVLEACQAGLSRYIGTGSEVDLDLADFVDFLANDDETSVIALVLDHAGDGDKFRHAVRRARAADKEIVALKLGNSDLGREATLAHSSHLSGTQSVYETVFAEEGIRCVPTLECLALTTALLSKGRVARSGGIAACSTSGGGAILLADLLSQRVDAESVLKLSDTTLSEIGAHLRFDAATIMNPFDLGLGGRHHYAANIMALAMDRGTAVLLVFGTPMATRAKREQLAAGVVDAAKARPDIAALYLSPAPLMDDEAAILRDGGVAVCASTLDAIAVAKALLPVGGGPLVGIDDAGEPVADSLAGPLPEHQSKDLLARYGVAFPREALVHSAEEAVAAAERIGFPVVLKASGQGIWHKSEMGFVDVGIADAEALAASLAAMYERIDAHPEVSLDGFIISEMVSDGIEAIVGVSLDPEFGPMLVVGPGGVLAEIYGAEAMRQASLPVGRQALDRLLDGSVLGKLLDGVRGRKPADREALKDMIIAVSNFCSQSGGRLAELDLNPVVIHHKGAVALDALVVLQKDDANKEEQP